MKYEEQYYIQQVEGRANRQVRQFSRTIPDTPAQDKLRRTQMVIDQTDNPPMGMQTLESMTT